jgi:drug/metabolite transporter (DMT)-like permease
MSGATVVAIALGSALAAAISSILQHHSARTAPDGRAGRLLGHLLKRPTWLVGAVAAVAGLILHVVALAHGQLALVQPLLISGVLFALPVSALMEGRRPSGREWLLAVCVVAGLATFLLAARPSRGFVRLDADSLLWTTIGTVLAMPVLVLVSRRWAGQAPAILGTAAGLGYGVVAALMKETDIVYHHGGLTHMLSDWPLYALVGIGLLSLAVTQMAYRAGPLARSMPALTVTDPAASVAIGVVIFQERLAHDPLAILLQVIGFLAMCVAAAQLARREAEHKTNPEPAGI